jgi:hypothetical protein
VDAGEHDLAVMVGKFYSLVQQLVDPARPVSAARDSRRAESTVLVAAVLDAEQSAGACLRLGITYWGFPKSDCCRNVVDRRTVEYPLNRWQRSKVWSAATSRSACTLSIELERRSASHDEAAHPGILTSSATNGLPQISLRVSRNGAAVENGDVGSTHGINDLRTGSQCDRAESLAVVLIRTTAKRLYEQLHRPAVVAIAAAVGVVNVGASICAGSHGSSM